MQTLGRHLLVEYYGCDAALLDDLDAVRRAMLAATEAVGATRVGDTFHRFAPQGVSGTVVIAESHLSVHTWPEAGYAAVDVFTCGGLDPRLAIAVLREALRATDVRAQEIVRGLPDEVAGPLRPGDVHLVVGAVEGAPSPPRPSGLDSKRGWFTEAKADRAHTLRVERVVCQVRTAVQDVLIFDNPSCGRVLVRDGAVRLTTADARGYHELLVHPSMVGHPAPRRVLIVGGGDGGALREVLRHDPEQVVLIERDAGLVALCREHLPGLSEGGFDDTRVTLRCEEPLAAIGRYEAHFDGVVVDGGGDETGSAAIWAGIRRALRPSGVCAAAGGSFMDIARVKAKRDALAAHLPRVAVHRATVPSFHGGEHAFFVATEDRDPSGPDAAELTRRVVSRGLAGELWHYTPEVHLASLVLPPALSLS